MLALLEESMLRLPRASSSRQLMVMAPKDLRTEAEPGVCTMNTPFEFTISQVAPFTTLPLQVVCTVSGWDLSAVMVAHPVASASIGSKSSMRQHAVSGESELV